MSESAEDNMWILRTWTGSLSRTKCGRCVDMSPTQDYHAWPAGGLQHSSFGDGGTKTGGGVPFDPPSPIRVCRGGRKFFLSGVGVPGRLEILRHNTQTVVPHTWDSWVPPLRHVCPCCGMMLVSRDIDPRCPRCSHREACESLSRD